MGVDKQSSKGGGSYVGGFLQLFDWNAKSRKKLFSSKSGFPEQSKQKKKSDGNLPMERLHLMGDDEVVTGSSIKGSSDYSCASSVTDEDGCGTKAPGVVARLMGLDSLPTSNFTEPNSTPFFDSQSLRDAHSHRKNTEFDLEYHQFMHSGNLQYKGEVPSKNTAEPKPLPKVINRPIEKFQTEVLPPKSAKSIPITHHKLLSPIKSPGFIPSKNAAHIMEAAAKIIDPGPQVSTKAKTPLFGSSSVPLKVKDLKEKMEAARKPSIRLAESSRVPTESNATKYLKGQSMNKSWNGSIDSKSFRASDSDDCSAGSQNRGRSISLALQAKANVQKREGLLNPSSSRSMFSQKEQNEVISSQPIKGQTNVQKATHKKTYSHNASGVLRQNNQKQNCPVDGGRGPSKPLSSNSQGRKLPSGDSLSQRQKSKKSGNLKVGSRKLGLEATTDGKREISHSSSKTAPRKKRFIDKDFQFDKNDGMLTVKHGNAMPNVVTDRQFNWAENCKRQGLDVVSFTFTAPMTRSISDPDLSGEVLEKNYHFSGDARCSNKLLPNSGGRSNSNISQGLNGIQPDALSTLLDQKLRELTLIAESSRHQASMAGCSSIFQDLLPMLNDKIGDTSTDNFKSQLDSDFSSTDSHGLFRKHKHQEVEEISECGSNDTGGRKSSDYRNPSPISVLQPSLFTESCNSSETAESCSTEGSKQYSSVQAQEVYSASSSKKFCLIETDNDLLDSASSTNAINMTGKYLTSFSGTDFLESSEWEKEYVKEILFNVELMFKDFASGLAREIINPLLFDQRESHKAVLGGRGAQLKLRRKVLFDCITESLDLRCRRYVGGGYLAWAKGESVVNRKGWLVEEVYKEISGWRNLSDCMVDELVDKDMSNNQHGKWLDFEVESNELGREMEECILNSLLDEVVADILPPPQ